MRFLVSMLAGATVLVACGGGQSPPAQSASDQQQQPTQAEVAQAEKPCGSADTTQHADLDSDKATDAFAPCAKGGPKDYSALVHIEPVDEGVHIIIDATDDDVTLLGPDVKSRDAVIVYPKGKGTTTAVEVPLEKTPTGYHGDKIVFWNDLDKLTDDGTKIDIAVYDHDKSGDSEELHVSVGLSTGKSCEKAQDENPQQVSMGKSDSRPDLTNAQLGAPINNANAAAACGLPDAAHAAICVLVRNGKPLGVTVNVDPKNNKIAACIDRRMRRLAFPVDNRPNTVTYNY